MIHVTIKCILDLLIDSNKHNKGIVTEALKLLKTLAGNDNVKKEIGESNGIHIIISAINNFVVSNEWKKVGSNPKLNLWPKICNYIGHIYTHTSFFSQVQLFAMLVAELSQQFVSECRTTQNKLWMREELNSSFKYCKRITSQAPKSR